MKWVINSYNGTTDWISEYTKNVIFYDKKEKNVGYNIYDYMDYIVNNYDNLPNLTLFGKDNMLERHITKKEFDKLVKRKSFTPLLTQNHKVYEPICHYKDGLYYEINDSWYFREKEHKHFSSYNEFAKIMGLPTPEYLGFAPGACYIVPRKNIKQHPREFYKKLMSFVDYSDNCAEAHAIERALHTIWS